MFQIKEITNSIFTSKTYIVYKEGVRDAWLIDIGDIEPVLVFCKEKKLSIVGVFLTHGHFDHIYGLLALMAHYPNCKVYTTEYGKQSLASDKLNMSKYHEQPIKYEGENVVVVHEGEEMTLAELGQQMLFYETPGHNPGCLTMVIGDIIFTGDAFIPEVGVNTQPPHSDKILAEQSLQRILKLAEGKRILSGHQVG